MKCKASILICSSRSESFKSAGMLRTLVIACDDDIAIATSLPLTPDFTNTLLNTSETASTFVIAFSVNASLGNGATPHATTRGFAAEPDNSTTLIE